MCDIEVLLAFDGDGAVEDYPCPRGQCPVRYKASADVSLHLMIFHDSPGARQVVGGFPLVFFVALYLSRMLN